jgi:hypothetical protein
MGGYWTFKDYVAADGVNEIHAWLNGLPERAKAKINWRISQLEQTPHLTRPATGKLHDDCEGFFELRVEVGNVQYRPICCHGPGDRDVTILFGAIEKGRKFVPLSACLIARRNSGHISERGRVCDHDIS